jgi:hypothetical protein
MAFYKVRTIGYDVAQTLGKANALLGGGNYSGVRQATYGSVKFLGDVNAFTGNRKGSRLSKIGRRLSSRLGGDIMRSGRVATGIPQLDAYVAKIASDQVGKRAQALQGEMYDSTKAGFVIDTGEMERYINSPEFIDKVLDGTGKALVSYAKTIAPAKTGKYKESFGYAVRNTADNRRQLVIYTNDPRWKYIEYGTSKTPATPVLRRLFEADPKVKRIR